jgi:hypothetical protein
VASTCAPGGKCRCRAPLVERPPTRHHAEPTHPVTLAVWPLSIETLARPGGPPALHTFLSQSLLSGPTRFRQLERTLGHRAITGRGE